MNPKKRRWSAPEPGGQISVTLKAGRVEYQMEMPPAKCRIVRGPDGKLIAIPIPPPEAPPIPENRSEPAPAPPHEQS